MRRARAEGIPESKIDGIFNIVLQNFSIRSQAMVLFIGQDCDFYPKSGLGEV